MARFIIHRIVYMMMTLWAISLIAFAIIQLPPGDFVTTYVASLTAAGVRIDEAELLSLRQQYGLDGNFLQQYLFWISGILQGDFGRSFEWNQPVSELIWDRLGASVLVELISIIVMWAIALPIGIYSAIRKYSLGDYVTTIFGFIGLAVPNFLLALILMYLSFRWTGTLISGLNAPEYIGQPLTWSKFVDFLGHVWAPVLVLATAGTAQLIRILRANLLDELRKPYVTAARARGLPEHVVILKYPVRVALNPLVASIGFMLPALISGSIVVSVVMSLPTSGPLLLRALLSQDMYLAGAFILLMGLMATIGTLISDILLALIDPRIRLS